MVSLTDQKYLVVIEQYTTSQDSDGNNEETVTFTIKRWVKVKRVGGGRTTSNGQTVLQDSIKFTVPFSYDFTPTGNWRVTYRGIKYTVQSIVPDQERRFNWEIIALGNG